MAMNNLDWRHIYQRAGFRNGPVRLTKTRSIRRGVVLLLGVWVLMLLAGGRVAAQTNSQIVRLAKLEIYPAQLERYKAALQEGIKTALRVEPGVLTLYAVVEKDHPTRITILEIYASEKAYRAHLQTPHALFAVAFVLCLGLSSQAQTVNKVPAAKATSAPGAIFPKGERAPAANFTGMVYVSPLVKDDPTFNCVSSSVTFTPGARSNWHTHPAGQILLVTDGTGYYQEKGQPIRLLHKGDVIKAQPGVVHWHGASPKQAMTHIALNVNTEKGVVTWLQPVTNQEYNSHK